MYELTTRVERFDQSIDGWIRDLNNYSLPQLMAKPSPNGWSVGQLYMHIIEASQFFIRQASSSSSHNENIGEEPYREAITMFTLDEFPDALLEGPPSNALTPQPDSKEQLITGLGNVKIKFNNAKEQVKESAFAGKTKHFGLGYFNALQWLQFAEMHLRHHLRQKARLDQFLKENNIL